MVHGRHAYIGIYSMGKRKRETTEEGGAEGCSSDSEVEEQAPAPVKRARLGSESKEESLPTMEEEVQHERENMQLLVSAFSNSQQDQYEIYRRSTFPKSTVRKLMQGVCGGTVPQNAVIAMAGITKVFVGEVIEEACLAREKTEDEGPLQPKHIREAVRKLKNKDKVPNYRYNKVFPLTQ